MARPSSKMMNVFLIATAKSCILLCIFIIPSKTRARMELIFLFSESALPAVPSGRAGIKIDEPFANHVVLKTYLTLNHR